MTTKDLIANRVGVYCNVNNWTVFTLKQGDIACLLYKNYNKSEIESNGLYELHNVRSDHVLNIKPFFENI